MSQGIPGRLSPSTPDVTSARLWRLDARIGRAGVQIARSSDCDVHLDGSAAYTAILEGTVVGWAQTTGTLRMDLVTDSAAEFYEHFEHKQLTGYRIYPGA